MTSTSTYPLAAYNFRVEIDGQTAAFSQVSGLGKTYATVTYLHGLSFAMGEHLQRYYLPRYQSLTFKRGVFPGPNKLEAWLAKGDDRSMEVHLCNEVGRPVLTWRIAHAVPIKLETDGFDASTNNTAVETLEVMVSGVRRVDQSG
jgi:phage tail-like protein